VSFTSLILSAPPPKQEEKPSTIARLGLSDHAVDPRFLITDSARGGRYGSGPVQDSEDLQRILALPRRPRPTKDQQAEMAREMTGLLRLERTTPCDCAALNPNAIKQGRSPCITDLNPVQGWALYEFAQAGGGLGFIIVGGGKTGIGALTPMVLPDLGRPRVHVHMLPPSLVDQFLRDFRLWSQHFKTPNLAGGKGPFDPSRPTLRILKYSELSRPNFSTWLKSMRPDSISCDEAQALKDPASVRTDRFLRYFEEEALSGRTVSLFAYSGSLTTRGLEDYTHLSALALREGSPVPLLPAVAKEWGLALDPAVGKSPIPMGALRHLCQPGERHRSGFQRRLVETLGVITTEDSELDVGLKIIERDPGPIPTVVNELLKTTRERDMRPDGEEFQEKAETVACLRQLAAGFFYRWKYPRGEPEELIEKWFGRRKLWNKEVRKALERRKDNLDSPELLTNAAIRYWTGQGEGLRWGALNWPAWAEVKDEVIPEQDTVWLDDFLVNDAAAWAKEGPGIIWFQHTAFGERLAEVTGLPFYRSKTDYRNVNPTPEMLQRKAALEKLDQWKENGAKWLDIEDGTRPVLCSIRAFHYGVNLQSFWRMLVCQNPSDGGTWEQLLGRPHRFGQPAEFVECHVYRFTPELNDALHDARERARYTFETTGKAEKLLYADYVRLTGVTVS
jgi:hypothetical protein